MKKKIYFNQKILFRLLKLVVNINTRTIKKYFFDRMKKIYKYIFF
jgi:hypothetical protein